MAARRPSDDEDSTVAMVRASSDAELARRFDPATYPHHSDFAHEFPGTHLRITGGDLGASIGWPWPGNDAGLKKLLEHYYASRDDAPESLLFTMMNDCLAAKKRPTWEPRDFAMIDAEVRDEAEARELHEDEKLYSRPPGRRKSQKTFTIDKIQAVLRCGQRRAYYIYTDGTTILLDRMKLALAFSNDPERCFPAAWKPQFDSKSWGRAPAATLELYVSDHVDAFEGGELGAVLAILIPRFEAGWLLPDDRLESLLAAIREQGLAISADAALVLWSAYTKWKRGQRD